MATANPEMDALPRGINVDAQTLGPWLANVYERKQALEVRPGFGQLSQNDSTLTLRNPEMDRGAVTFGYTKVLGSQAMRTSFGHTQICTVLVALGYTGSGWNGPISSNLQLISSGAAQTYVVLSVHNVTTNETQEFLLHRHTAENSPTASTPQDWRGLWSSYNNEDYGAIYKGFERRVWFCEFRDTLLFGSPELGNWAYRPVDVSGLRRQWIETHKTVETVTGYSESSAVWPLVGSDGAFADNYPYLPPSVWPRVVDACVVGNRVAFADSDNLYFSDPGNPCSIMAQNVIPSGSDRAVTAVASVLGQVVFFTETETFAFTPEDKAIVSGGRKIKLSDAIGCLGPQTKVKADDMLAWVDNNGVWQTKGDFNITNLTKGIEPLFESQLQNPLSYWFQTQLVGFTPSTSAHIHNVYDWRDTADVCLAYEAIHDLLFVAIPAYNISLVKQSGGWKIWTWDTLATSLANDTTVTRNVAIQALTTFQGDVYLTHGIDVLTPTDTATTDGNPIRPRNENQAYGSYALLKWKRGGALDRSVEATEDGRLGGGWYVANQSITVNDGAVYLGEPVVAPAGYVLPGGSVMTAGGLLYPVILRSCSLAANSPPDTVRITMNYDNNSWTPVQFGAGTEVDVLFPAPRIRSAPGWGYTAPIFGVREIQVYGNQIRMFFFGTGLAPGLWSAQPYLNVTPLADAVLFWLPFVSATFTTTMSLGVTFPSAPVQNDSTVGPAVSLSAFWYEQPWQLPLQTSDAVAQAVDWVVKTAQLGLESSTQTRARGLFMRVATRGSGTTPIVASWLYSQINALVASDWKEWTSQIVDHPTQNPSEENSWQTRLPGLRARLFDTISAAMATRTFNNKATWGDSATAATGNFLVDDGQVDTLAISSGVKGEHVSWMLFGNMLNRAEALSISSVKAILQERGQRRRIGRK